MIIFVLIIFVVSLSCVGLYYYLRWHKYLFLKHEKVLHSGIGKYFVRAKKYEHYVQSIKGEECLYYSLMVGSMGSGNTLYDVFPTDNNFLFEVGDDLLLMDSSAVEFDIQKRFLSFAVVPSMMSRFLTKSPTKDEYIEFYHNHSVTSTHKRAYSYYDISIYEDMEYTLIVKIKNGAVDTSFKPIVIDNYKREIMKVLITTVLIMLPAIITILALVSKL